MLKKSDDLHILVVTFDYKKTFEKHLPSVSRPASQRLCILRKSWQVFHDRLHLGRYYRGYALPVLEYCSAVWYLAADTHLQLLDRAVSGASFLTLGVIECDLAHRRSREVFCMLYKVRRNPMHPLHGCLPVPHVCQAGLQAVLCSQIGILMRLLAARTSQHCRTFFLPLSVSLWNDIADLYSIVW